MTGEGEPVESDLPAERKARREIDEMLRAAGWVVQDKKDLAEFQAIADSLRASAAERTETA